MAFEDSGGDSRTFDYDRDLAFVQEELGATLDAGDSHLTPLLPVALLVRAAASHVRDSCWVTSVLRATIVLVGVVAALPSTSLAQTGGSIAGRVLDHTQLVLPGVTVEVRDAARDLARLAVTGADGAYILDDLPPGPVELSFTLINFSTERQQVTVIAGQTVSADAVLSVSLSADITITAPLTFRNTADIQNPAGNLVGIAAAASEGAITAVQLEARPIMRAAEVLETVPGMIISQHSGEGKANQYYLRSFNLDHGSDFATTVAGVPVNNPTHGHAQGYSDANFLIPELVSGLQFTKGPYYAEEGDFSVAGAVNVNYVNRLDRPIVLLSGGTDAWGRLFAAASPPVAGGHLLAGLELNRNGGPWVRPDDYTRANGILRYSRGDSRNGFSLTGMGYSADWNSSDQVPVRAVESGIISRFGTIDDTDGGKSFRYAAVADAQRSGGRHSTRATGYLVRYGMNLFQNFTYLLDDPVNGDQFEQVDRRVTAGGRVTYRQLGRVGEHGTETVLGAQVRHDAIGEVGLYKTANRRRLSTTRRDEVQQTSVSVFAQSEIEWNPVVRTTVGLRGDVYRFDVASDNPLNGGTESAGILSPKISTAFGFWTGTELYLNAGFGFHSNHGLGVTLAVDPKTGGPAEAAPPLVRGRGAEVGLRTVRIRGLQSTFALWMLGFDSELLFIGDAGSTEAGRPSQRLGFEWTNYAHPTSWLTLDADLAFSRSRFTDDDPIGDAIPGALGRVLAGGLTIEPARGPFGSLRLRHFGPRELLEDRSVKSEQTTILNGEVGYRFGSRTRLVVELFNVLDAEVADIDYYYASRLAGEVDGGIEGVHTHPALPRSARVALRFDF